MAVQIQSRSLLRQFAANANTEYAAIRSLRQQHRDISIPCQQGASSSLSHRSLQHSPHSRTPRRYLSSTARRTDQSSTSSTTSSSPASEEITTPLNLQNHYTLFPQTIPSGPPPASPFTIPVPQLRREFLQLQSKYHPDKFPSDQKMRAEALSSRINTAYKTLADPLLRAQYILNEFHGVDVLAEDQGTAHQDPATLMEVMEAQEAIEEASEEDEIEELKEQNKKRIEDSVKVLSEAFDRGEIETARKECIKLRFWRSLQDGLHSWEPGKEVRLMH